MRLFAIWLILFLRFLPKKIRHIANEEKTFKTRKEVK